MARSKQSIAAPDAPTEEQLGQLTTAVESLTHQVETLAGHLEIIQQVLDEIRVDFQWAVRNDRFGTGHADEWRPVTHVTSMPKDPCAPDFGERLNRYTAKDIPAETSVSTTPSEAAKQGTLFE